MCAGRLDIDTYSTISTGGAHSPAIFHVLVDNLSLLSVAVVV